MLHSCLTRWKRSGRKGSSGDQNRNYEYEQESDADAFQNKGASKKRGKRKNPRRTTSIHCNSEGDMNPFGLKQVPWSVQSVYLLTDTCLQIIYRRIDHNYNCFLLTSTMPVRFDLKNGFRVPTSPA